MNNEDKLYITQDSTLEYVVNPIDWDNFTYKTWRYLYNYVWPFINDNVKEELKALLDTKPLVDFALSEASRLVGKEYVEQYLKPMVFKWREEGKIERKIADSIFLGLSKHTLDNIKDRYGSLENIEGWEQHFGYAFVQPIEDFLAENSN